MVARHTRHLPPLERGRRQRDDTAPGGSAAAEPGRHLDRNTRRRAIGPGTYHPATSLAIAGPVASLPAWRGLRLDAWWTGQPLDRTRTTHLQRLDLTAWNPKTWPPI